MGIDRIHFWLSKFGYGQYSGIDLMEQAKGVLPDREWKLKVHKRRGIKATLFLWGLVKVIGRLRRFKW